MPPPCPFHSALQVPGGWIGTGPCPLPGPRGAAPASLLPCGASAVPLPSHLGPAALRAPPPPPRPHHAQGTERQSRVLVPGPGFVLFFQRGQSPAGRPPPQIHTGLTAPPSAIQQVPERGVRRVAGPSSPGVAGGRQRGVELQEQGADVPVATLGRLRVTPASPRASPWVAPRAAPRAGVPSPPPTLCSPVRPSPSAAEGSAPCSRRSRTTGRWPQ